MIRHESIDLTVSEKLAAVEAEAAEAQRQEFTRTKKTWRSKEVEEGPEEEKHTEPRRACRIDGHYLDVSYTI